LGAEWADLVAVGSGALGSVVPSRLHLCFWQPRSHAAQPPITLHRTSSINCSHATSSTRLRDNGDFDAAIQSQNRSRGFASAVSLCLRVDVSHTEAVKMETITIPSPSAFLSSPVLKPAPDPPPPPKRKPSTTTKSASTTKKQNGVSKPKQSKSRNGTLGSPVLVLSW